MILTKLVLSCPKALADTVVEFLLESEWDTFTTVNAAGHGPNRTDRRRKASKRPRSTALAYPHHAEAAYDSLVTTVA